MNAARFLRPRHSETGPRKRFAAIFAILLFSLSSVYAQNQATSAPLASISITGSSRFSSDQIASAIGMHTGANVTRADLQAAADRLSKLGLFSNVQYRFATVDGSVKVEYQVTDGPEIPVAFDNLPWFTDDDLKAALKDSGVLFDGLVPHAGEVLDEISAALAHKIQTRGLTGTVTHMLVSSPVTGQQIQQFRVDGADATVSSVEFSDALAKSDRGLQERLSDIVGKPYSRSALELFEFEQVRPIYFAHGYLRVKFGAPAAHVPANTNASSPVTLSVPVDPGASYVWGGIAWSGNSALPSTVLDTLAKLKFGDPADGLKIELLWNDVRDAYWNQGYLDADLTPTPQFNESSKHVSYNVSIAEGPQYHMGALQLTGLSVEGEQRIRAAWRIPPGAVFDKSVYDDFLENGINAAFKGTSFHYEKIGRFLQQDAASGKVDVLLDFQ